MSAETSDKVSTLASRYANITKVRLQGLTATDAMAEGTAAEIRSMAASLLRQDERKGLRGLFKRVMGGG